MKLKFLALSIFIFSLPALAQSPSKILRQAEKALGGAKAVQGVNSWSKMGQITRLRDGASGQFEMQASQPNLYRIAYDLGGLETASGSNGRSGWVRDAHRGLSSLTGDAGRDFQAEAAYRNWLWLNYKKDRSRITLGRPTLINERQANTVILTTAKGISINLYFDALTYLPLREEIPAGDSMKTFDYSDYQMVDGIKQPFTIKFTEDEERYEIRLGEIKINPVVAPAAFYFPHVSGAPLPDVPKLLTELQNNEERIEKLLDTYSFKQKYITRETGKDSILRETGSRTYQLSFYKGNRIRRLIEKNNRPLSDKEQADEDREAVKQVEEIEKQIAKREAKAGQPDEENRISLVELLRASKLINPRREHFRGRDVIVFDFEPNPSFDYRSAKGIMKLFGKMAGVMWIDEKDKQIARLEAALTDHLKMGGGVLAKLKKGASFTMEQERVNDEIWLPSQTDVNLSLRLLLVKGIDVNQIVRTYDYRKFATEVKDAGVRE